LKVDVVQHGLGGAREGLGHALHYKAVLRSHGGFSFFEWDLAGFAAYLVRPRGIGKPPLAF
jgi:hypothetical protein